MSKKPAKKERSTARDGSGRMVKGNAEARGGRRKNAGRKPETVRLAREAFFASKFDRADAIIDMALSPTSAVPWEQKIKTAIWIKEGVYGKNTIRMEVSEDSSAVRYKLEAAGAAKVAAIGEAHRKDS